jgi:hypothetical protein
MGVKGDVLAFARAIMLVTVKINAFMFIGLINITCKLIDNVSQSVVLQYIHACTVRNLCR